MNVSDIARALGDVDEQYIREAESFKKSTRKIAPWICAAAVACACVAVAVSFGVRNSYDPQLPILTVSDDIFGEYGYGFEGYWANDISELKSGNPWTENARLATLPVFKNPLVYDENHNAADKDFAKMEQMLYDVAGRLGLSESDITVTDDTPTEEEKEIIKNKYALVGDEVPKGLFEPSKLIGKANGLTITVMPEMTAAIEFTAPVDLPAEYNFSYYCSYRDTQKTAEFLKEKYSGLLNMKNPTIAISGGDYDIYKRQDFELSFFDGNGNLTEQIINYNFRSVYFAANEDGQLWIIRIRKPDLSEKVGDYPIISAAEAKKLLSLGKYITSVPYEMPGIEYAASVELIYLHHYNSEYFLPYYKFLVELPDSNTNIDMKEFGAYYVPAVREDYIESIPEADIDDIWY